MSNFKININNLLILIMLHLANFITFNTIIFHFMAVLDFNFKLLTFNLKICPWPKNGRPLKGPRPNVTALEGESNSYGLLRTGPSQACSPSRRLHRLQGRPLLAGGPFTLGATRTVLRSHS